MDRSEYNLGRALAALGTLIEIAERAPLSAIDKARVLFARELLDELIQESE